MTVASCPSCRERVTVPVDATPQCIVRCPLCHEEFELAAFLAQLPPLLIVLRDESRPTDTQSMGGHMSTDSGIYASESSSRVLESLDVTGKLSVDHDCVPAFDFTPGSVDEGEGVTAVATPAPRGATAEECGLGSDQDRGGSAVGRTCCADHLVVAGSG